MMSVFRTTRVVDEISCAISLFCTQPDETKWDLVISQHFSSLFRAPKAQTKITKRVPILSCHTIQYLPAPLVGMPHRCGHATHILTHSASFTHPWHCEEQAHALTS